MNKDKHLEFINRKMSEPLPLWLVTAMLSGSMFLLGAVFGWVLGRAVR